MSSDNLHKPLQSISTLFNHFIREPIREDLLSAEYSYSARERATFPGRGGIFTLVLSLSRISLKASKSEYRRLTTEWRNLNAGIFV
jgi:hypothetical protein